MSDGRDDLRALVSAYRSAASPFRIVLDGLYEKYRTLRDGNVADYIPELAKADPDWFAISVATVDGQTFDVGQFQQPFTIQSVSKPFVYGMALEQHGREAVLEKVWVEPTGDVFNSIIKLDEQTKRPHNPMVNAGAIAVTSLIQGNSSIERLNSLLEMFGRYTGRPTTLDVSVFMSEKATGHRKRAIAHLMLNFGMIDERVDENLDLYFQQCSVLVTSRDLALMGATLANEGVNPITGQVAIPPEYIQDLLSIMLTCGMYDYSGAWVYDVGVPAKSGVSGAIVGVIPGVLGLAVYSPLLDEHWNSVRGINVFHDLSREYGLHLFTAQRDNKLAAAISSHSRFG
jgi:glutaminase